MSFDKKLDEFTDEVSKLWKKAKKVGRINYQQLVAQNGDKAIAACPAYVELGEELVNLREWIVNTNFYLQKVVTNFEKAAEDQVAISTLFADLIARHGMTAERVEEFASATGTYKTRAVAAANTVREGNDVKLLNELRDESAKLARMKQKWYNNLLLKTHFEERKNSASPENQERLQADFEYRERKCLYYEQTVRDGIKRLAQGKAELAVSLTAVHELILEEQAKAFKECFDAGLAKPPPVEVE